MEDVTIYTIAFCLSSLVINFCLCRLGRGDTCTVGLQLETFQDRETPQGRFDKCGFWFMSPHKIPRMTDVCVKVFDLHFKEDVVGFDSVLMTLKGLIISMGWE